MEKFAIPDGGTITVPLASNINASHIGAALSQAADSKTFGFSANDTKIDGQLVSYGPRPNTGVMQFMASGVKVFKVPSSVTLADANLGDGILGAGSGNVKPDTTGASRGQISDYEGSEVQVLPVK